MQDWRSIQSLTTLLLVLVFHDRLAGATRFSESPLWTSELMYQWIPCTRVTTMDAAGTADGVLYMHPVPDLLGMKLPWPCQLCVI